MPDLLPVDIVDADSICVVGVPWLSPDQDDLAFTSKPVVVLHTHDFSVEIAVQVKLVRSISCVQLCGTNRSIDVVLVFTKPVLSFRFSMLAACWELLSVTCRIRSKCVGLSQLL